MVRSLWSLASLLLGLCTCRLARHGLGCEARPQPGDESGQDEDDGDVAAVDLAVAAAAPQVQQLPLFDARWLRELQFPHVAIRGRGETNLGGEINALEGGRLSPPPPPITPTNFARALQAD